MAVRMKEVAKLAGASIGTVSKVLNGKPSGLPIGKDTCKRVLDAARTLGYRPNPIAQSLRTQQTMTIGVVIEASKVHTRLIKAVELEIQKSGYSLLLAICGNDIKREQEEIKALLYRRVDGLVLLSPSVRSAQRNVLEELVADRFPLVAVGPMVIPGINFVDWDRLALYRQLAEYLLAQGCRRFGFVGYGEALGVKERMTGLKAVIQSVPGTTLEHLGGDSDAQWCSCSDLAQLVARPLKERAFDAVVCHTDELALAVMQQAMFAGYEVPRELAVVGCGDASFTSLMPLPLTTIREPYVQMVRLGVDYLIQCLEQPKAQRKQLMQRVPGKLLVRHSSRFGKTGNVEHCNTQSNDV